jgi:hypothetical protein
LKRQPPDVVTLLRLLNDGGVRYVVTGSAAAMLHGVPLVPGDLDITPARDHENLTHLANVLAMVGAHQDPEAPFGEWETSSDGEQHWVQREPTPADITARASWNPDPDDPGSFDHLLQSEHGALDIVPQVSGTYEDLIPHAVVLDANGQQVWVESVEDLLATLTVPRRQKDRDRVTQLRAIQRSSRARRDSDQPLP